jgi:hypothetical protein
MSRLARMAVALLLCSAVAVACGDDDTSLFLRVTNADGATQLRVRGVRGEEPWFGPVLAPETAGEPFSGEQTLRIRFTTPPDAPGLVEVDALQGGEAIARGSAEASPRKGEEVELRIGLSDVTVEPGTDGGTDAGTDGGTDAGTPDGGEPDAGLPDAGAPDAGGGCSQGTCAGCCQPNGTCVSVTSARACGLGGLECVDCGEVRANTCSPSGLCSCGTRGSPCGEGQRCNGSTCECDPNTCAGCCSGNDCRPGNTLSACDTGLDQCTVCNAATADNCSNGGCRCGTGSPCNPSSADNCSNGGCRCGNGPACSGLTSRCRDSTCVI